MTAQIIDGKALSRQLREGFKTRVAALLEQGLTPGLAVILIGDNPASRVYVGNKVKACEVQQLRVQQLRVQQLRAWQLPALQLPLPPHIDGPSVLEAISVHKDVDGFHLYNVGGLVVGNTIFPPCTPYGVQLLLDTTGTEVAGKNVVVVGASNIVGKPMALMLLQREATVTICHARTRDLAQHTILADILIVAAGRPGWSVLHVDNGAIVIDVGINRLPDGKIVGDVDFAGVREKASWITPVPGGVGPMTVTMLIENPLRSAERALRLRHADDYQEWEAPILKGA